MKKDMERKKMNFNILTSLLLLFMALAGCSRVNTTADKSANLSNYRTYSWIEPELRAENPLYKGDLIDQSIRESVENELAQKGMVRDDVSPDVYVKYSTFAETKHGYTGPSYNYHQFYGGYAPMGLTYGPSPIVTSTSVQAPPIAAPGTTVTPEAPVNSGAIVAPGSVYSYGFGDYGYMSGAGYMSSAYPARAYSYTEETLILDFIDASTDKVVWRGSIANEVRDTKDIDKQMEKGVHSIMKKFGDDAEDDKNM
jgi:hypothetical protein